MEGSIPVGLGTLRGVLSGVLLLAFIGIWLWAYSARRRATYQAAALLPLEEDIEPGESP